MKVENGQLIAMTSGEYSDYEMITIVRATSDFDISELKKEYLSENPEQKRDYHFNDGMFLKWLIVDRNVVDELDYQEWHIGSYNCGDMELRAGWSATKEFEEQRWASGDPTAKPPDLPTP